jgi:CTP:molybdopterin cytidylyltransferase MocA
VLVVQGDTPLPTLPRTRVVANHEWRTGQLGSLQVGIRSVRADAPDVDGLLVLAVDRPSVRPATVAALAQAWRRNPGHVWQPAFEGQRGHPIVYPADLLDVLLALPAGASARELLRSQTVRERRRALDVDDPGILLNVDTPDDLRRLGA